MSRGTLLAFSILVSLGVHAAFFAVAPSVMIVSAVTDPQDLLISFQVQLAEDTPLADEILDPADDRELMSGPGAIEDLMKRDAEALKPAEEIGDSKAEVPRLRERLAKEGFEREHDLDQDADLLQAVDTKLIEITQAEMRENIQVARRLVAPSTDRILENELLPTLRGNDPVDREKITDIDPLRLHGGGASGEGTGDEKATAEPPRPESPPPDEALEAQATPSPLPELPPEKDVARAPVMQAVAEESGDVAFMDELVDVALETYVPAGEEEGYFRLRIEPKKDASIQPLPKDVTFVIDASSSILQRKLDETVDGVIAAVGQLGAEDRFNIVVFRDNASQFHTELVPAAQENKDAAREWLAGIESRGETDVYSGIRPVVTQVNREGVPRIVMVVTDGRPTTGMRDGRDIINALTDENANRDSIYAYSGGRTVNRYLLDLLAYRNKGEAFVSDDIAEMGQELPRFFGNLKDPLLVDCEADFGRVNENEVFPRELPDFYRGQAVTVYGRYRPGRDDAFAMRLLGKAGDKEKEVVFQTDLSKAASGNEQIARNWAFRKVYYLIGEMCRVGETPELKSQIRALSEQYGIETSYSD